MEKDSVILSIIIPVYNAEEYLPRTLDSVLTQSLREIEVICVDDGSMDGSVGVIEAYMARDPRVSLIRQQNRYAGIARNAGIEAAKGEYLFFLDADDYVLESGLELVCARARKHKLDCLKFLSLTLDEKRGCYLNKKVNNGGMLRPEHVNHLVSVGEDSPLFLISVAPWSGIYRRAFVLENNCRFNPLRCVNDRSFYTKVITTGKRLMITQDWVTVHRENQDQSLVGTKAKHFDCQVESVLITERQLEEDQIEPGIRDRVLRQEWNDLTFWYRKFTQTPERKQDVDGQIRAFMASHPSHWDEKLEELMNASPDEMKKISLVTDPYDFQERVSHPAVTVLVPFRNDEETLARALTCLMRQTLKEIEVLMLDCGSTDRSPFIQKEYAAMDGRFEAVDCAGLTWGQAVNRGLSAARGEWIAFLDPADFVEPMFYERICKTARKKRLDLLWVDYHFFQVDQACVLTLTPKMLVHESFLYNRTFCPAKNEKIAKIPGYLCTALILRERVSDETIRFDPETRERFRDQVFWRRLLSQTRRMRLGWNGMYYAHMPEKGFVPVGPEDADVTGAARVRRAVSRLPRKAWTGYWMIREHGLKTTWKYISDTLHGSSDAGKRA